MDDKRLAALAGVEVEGGYEPAVWDQLDRKPDTYDKKTRDLVAEGKPKAHLLNLSTILAQDSRLRGRIRYNQFNSCIEFNGEQLTDDDETSLAIWLGRHYDITCRATLVHEVIGGVAKAFSYHPVRDYLRRITWDGESRVADWLAVYMGAQPSELNGELGKRFLMSCIARVMEPGCKCDHVLILAGAQGIKKSTGLRTLCGAEWFSDTTLDLGRADAMAALQGQWLYEWPELDSVRRRDATTIKAFLSSQVDRYRPSYGRNHVRQPRQVVFVGTTNEATFLKDSTGDRRYWPVQVTEIDLEAIEEDRDQLWAEAMAFYRDEPRWWLCDEMEAQLIEAQRAFKDVDPWAEAIERWIETRAPGQGFTKKDLMEGALELPAKDQHRHHQARVMGIMDGLPVVRHKWRKDGLWLRGWRVEPS
jgi:putative DNA primase/helicase